MKVFSYEPRLTFLMPEFASSLSPCQRSSLLWFSKPNLFSKYRVCASVNELSVDQLQLLLSARRSINANSLLLLSVPAQALRLPDRHCSPLRVWASVRSFDSSEVSWRQPLKVSMMLKINTVHSVSACQNLKPYGHTWNCQWGAIFPWKSGTFMRKIKLLEL